MKRILIAATLLNFLPIAIAGPQDKWVYVGTRYDIVAFLIVYFAILYLLAKRMKVIGKK